MADLSASIGPLKLKTPVFLAAGPLTTRLENLVKAEAMGVGAVDTKAAVSVRHPKTKCYNRIFWEARAGVLNWMLGLWGGEFLFIDEAVEFIKQAKKELTIPVFGNFKGRSDQAGEWVDLAKRLEEAGADALVTFFTFLPDFQGREIEMTERIIGPVCSKVKIPVIFKLPPEAGLAADVADRARAMEEAGAAALQIGDGIGGLPGLAVDRPPYHPFDALEFQGRDGFISGPFLKPLVYKSVYEYARATRLPIICSGGVWDARSAIEAILYGASLVASSSGPCIKGWAMFPEIIGGIEAYMDRHGLTSIQDFRGLAGRYVRENDQIDFPDCRAEVDEDECTGCGECLTPAHCRAMTLTAGRAKVEAELCVGCGLCKHLCPVGAIAIKTV